MNPPRSVKHITVDEDTRPAADVKAFLCRLVRGEEPGWPPSSDEAFYRAFLQQSAHHGVDLLACHVLTEQQGWENLPSEVAETLDQRLKNAIAVEMARSHDARLLQELLEKAGIRALLMKGAALSYTHYPAPYLRPRVDADIFIALKDIEGIRVALENAGYQLEGWVFKSHQFKAMRPGFGGRMIKYDVHWRSSNHARFALLLDHETVLQQAVPITELGDFRTFSPGHALLQALLHRAGNPGHDPDRLIWLYDVHLLVAGLPKPELNEFARQAVDGQIQDICLEPLEKCREYFGTPVPGQVLNVLRESDPAGPTVKAFRGSQLALMVEDLRALPGNRIRFDYLREFLFPPKAYLLERYGKTGSQWLPVLYFRYLMGGVFEKLALR